MIGGRVYREDLASADLPSRVRHRGWSGLAGERARLALAASPAFWSLASASDSACRALTRATAASMAGFAAASALSAAAFAAPDCSTAVFWTGTSGGGLPGRGIEVGQGLDGGRVLGVGLRGAGLGRLERFGSRGGRLLGRGRFGFLGGGLHLVEGRLRGRDLLGGGLLGAAPGC